MRVSRVQVHVPMEGITLQQRTAAKHRRSAATYAGGAHSMGGEALAGGAAWTGAAAARVGRVTDA